MPNSLPKNFIIPEQIQIVKNLITVHRVKNLNSASGLFNLHFTPENSINIEKKRKFRSNFQWISPNYFQYFYARRRFP